MHLGKPFAAAAAALTVLAAATAPTVEAAGAFHSQAQAERNVLNAPRALRRWAPVFVDRETHLVRRNVSVGCRGLGRPDHRRRYERFACVVSFEHTRVRMTYWAQSGNGFELHGRVKRTS